jgi:transcriptional regulator with XRE-family HTH domain
MTPTPTDLRPWVELTAIVTRDGHWTREALAVATGFTESYVRHLESGRRTPTATAIRRFADALKVPASTITPPHAPTRRAYRPNEVAAMIGVTDSEVADLIESRELKVRVTTRGLLVTDEALTAFLSDQDSNAALENGDAA